MFVPLLSTYNRAYFFYKKQTDYLKRTIDHITRNSKIYLIIKYGKIMGCFQAMMNNVENNWLFSVFKRISNIFNFNNESTTHWIRTITYCLNTQEKEPWYCLPFLNKNKFVTVYSSPNFIKNCKSFEDVEKLFNNYCDDYSAYAIEESISHTQITMKCDKVYIHRIITGINFISHLTKLVQYGNKSSIHNITEQQGVMNLDMYIPNSVNRSIEHIKLYENVEKIFIYATYIHPKIEIQVDIDLKDHYLSGNSILSNIFVYNYLSSIGYVHLYSDDYTLELLDINFNKVILRSNEYITIYKENYIMKEIAMKMI